MTLARKNRKIHALVILSLLISMLLTSCVSTKKKYPPINPENVVTTGVAQRLGAAEEQYDYINIEMTKGKRPDESTSEWKGQFQIRLHNGNEAMPWTYSIMPLVINGNKNLTFKDKFSIVVDDYNSNSVPDDFTLGQYYDEYGSVYEIFTILTTGKIMHTTCDGILYVAEFEPSIQLNKIDRDSFSVPSYDAAKGEIVEKVYTYEVTGESINHYSLNMEDPSHTVEGT